MDEVLENAWNEVQRFIKERFGKSADMKSVLFIIGLREMGRNESSLTKEQKMDLMNLAFCRISSLSGYFEIKENDEDGWPIWKQVKPLPQMNSKEQEIFIKEHVITYFKAEKLIN